MILINLKGIRKIFGKDDGKVEALNGIDLTINEGEMVSIMGTSGSGKSTLLNIIGLLDKPTEGSYEFKGHAVDKLKDKELACNRNESIGFVVQNFALIDDYTVSQNIRVPLDYTKMTRREKNKKVKEIVEKIGLSDKLEKLPNQLSGGQNQRVAIARALVNNPNIILADEPTGALDKKTGNEVIDLFEELNKEGKTIIIITHDENVAKRCKRIIYIEDGKIIGDERNE